ncbi:MAG: hypothetical protein ACYC35_22890 [Pirellulales bacterium]
MKCTPSTFENPEVNPPTPAATPTTPAATPTATAATPTAIRPRIVVTDHSDRAVIVDQAVKALAARGGIFEHRGKLVEIITPPPPPPGSAWRPEPPWIHVLQSPRIRELLSGAIEWLRRGRDGTLQPIHPPDWAAPGVRRRGCWPGIRAIDSVDESGVARD